MGGITVGNDFSTRQDLPNYPQKTRSDGVWTKIEKFRIKREMLTASLPAVGAVEESGLGIKTIDLTESIEGFPGVCEVTLTWGGSDSSGGGGEWNGVDNNSETTYSSDTVRQEKQIESHPDWNTFVKNTKSEWVDKLKEAYPVFTLMSVVFRCTTRKSKKSFKFTEAVILGNVDKIEAPPMIEVDPENKTEGRWMNIGKQITFTKGDSVEIVESWQYDQTGWKKTIKANTTLADILAELIKATPT